jgi:hypothetical protein
MRFLSKTPGMLVWQRRASGDYWASQWYGVQFDTGQSDPDGERIASDMDAHLIENLPVHSEIKACTLNDDGTVNYYLDADDWSKQEDGSASNLDGTDGQVVMEIPEHYYRDWTEYGKRKMAVSLSAQTSYTKVNKFYIGAYEAALYRPDSKLASVVNTSADYRGGNNNAAWDGADNSLLGKPATLITRTNFRTYARNRGATNWNLLPFWNYMHLYRLFIIEYATRNSQKAVNAAADANGYRQGGLGDGVTTIVAADWDTFSSYYPFVPCGSSDTLASGSGEVDYVVTGWPGGDETVKVPRYRGVENPFGHIWEWVDGININCDTTPDPDEQTSYIIDDYANFADDTSANARDAGEMPGSGYIEELSEEDMIPTSAGGAGTGELAYWCDYFHSDLGDDGWRALRVGGCAYAGAFTGFACSNAQNTAAYTFALIGGRLCYMT